MSQCCFGRQQIRMTPTTPFPPKVITVHSAHNSLTVNKYKLCKSHKTAHVCMYKTSVLSHIGTKYEFYTWCDIHTVVDLG